MYCVRVLAGLLEDIIDGDSFLCSDVNHLFSISRFLNDHLVRRNVFRCSCQDNYTREPPRRLCLASCFVADASYSFASPICKPCACRGDANGFLTANMTWWTKLALSLMKVFFVHFWIVRARYAKHVHTSSDENVRRSACALFSIFDESAVYREKINGFQTSASM